MFNNETVNEWLRNRASFRREIKVEEQTNEQNAAINDWLRAQNPVVPRNLQDAFKQRLRDDKGGER